MPDDTRSDWTFQHWHAYQGPLGEVVCNGRYFFRLEGRMPNP
jgi:hypothetical protein